MADVFRKSFFGFNCDDVIEYIKKTHSDYSNKEKDLNEKAEKLSSDLSEQKRQNEDLKSENENLRAALKQYTEREDEIKAVSEKIGRLYLVSQANAKAIIDNAEENRRIADKEVQYTIDSLKEANEALKTISSEVTKTSEDYSEKINHLSERLEYACEGIEENGKKSDESSDILRLVKENLA